MTTLDDIANFVLIDILKRPNDTDVQDVCRKAALSFFKVMCDKVPFDELQITSAEIPLTASVDTYTIGTHFVFNPLMRAIANIRITFDSSNKRRLRRSHVRTYDALSVTNASRPATYARWDNTIQLNPPPDSSAYTLRFRYWSRPVIGVLYNISAASWLLGSATFTVPSTIGITNGDIVSVQTVSPIGYNGNWTVTSHTSTQVVVTMTNNPGAYVTGGTLNDQTSYWTYPLVTPESWDELLKWETLYRVYFALGRNDEAAGLMTGGQGFPRQAGSPRKQRVFETGIIPRLWNDLLETTSQNENVDEDFNINPVIRAYSVR
jgi:hypothetical protein